MIKLCILLLFFGSGRLLAQDIVRQQSIDSAAVMYSRMAGKQLPLYYGKEQEDYQQISIHPYFVDWRFANARLMYGEVIYPEVLLRLDINRDELIVISPDYRQIVLFPENVDFVELHGKHIIYFQRDTLPGCPSSGYYILLHSGNCKVLEKQTATLRLNSSTREPYYAFTTQYYLHKDGVYYAIRNKKGLLKALSPYKKELKRFISANHLRFRQNAEEFLSRTVSEYEKITGSL